MELKRARVARVCIILKYLFFTNIDEGDSVALQVGSVYSLRGV